MSYKRTFLMLHSVFMVFLSHKKWTKIVTGLLKWVWHPPNFLVSFILYINISDKIVLSDARWRFSNLFSVMFSFYNFIPSKIIKKKYLKVSEKGFALAKFTFIAYNTCKGFPQKSYLNYFAHLQIFLSISSVFMVFLSKKTHKNY